MKNSINVDVFGVDSLIESTVRTFGSPDPVKDNQLEKKLESLNFKADMIRSKRMRQKIKLFASLGQKITLLHQDTHLNYAALGPILNLYTQSAVELKDMLFKYRVRVEEEW